MANLSRLAEAIIKLKQKDAEGFEDLYLMTYKDTYADISSFLDDERKIWTMLKKVYLQVWHKSSSMPEANIIHLWIRVIIIDSAKNEGLYISGDFPNKMQKEEIRSEEKAAEVLIDIEEELGFFEKNDIVTTEKKVLKKIFPKREIKQASIPEIENKTDEEREDEKNFFKDRPYLMRLLIALLVTGIALGVIRYVIGTIINDSMAKKFAGGIVEETSKEIVLTEEALPENISVFGWNENEKGFRYKKPDGRFMLEEWLEEGEKLYYFDDTGYMVVGIKKIGIQSFKFDKDGALSYISRDFEMEDNKEKILKIFNKAKEEGFLQNIVDSSLQHSGDWVYFLSKTPESKGFPDLMRFREEDKGLEMIAEDVEGYIIINERVWFCSDKKMKKFES